MKLAPLIICAALFAAAGASHATERGRGRVAPPVPPVPPLPAMAELPPIAPLAPLAPMAPTPPMPPMPPMAPPPAPPEPPAMPVVPEAAHKACMGKAVGTKATYHLRRGATMRGTCEKDSKGMYFEMSDYNVVN
ncbi:MAG: hypothetical protein V4631_03785 [Pseudomonadota bacterium]